MIDFMPVEGRVYFVAIPPLWRFLAGLAAMAQLS
jgi:hypothetical protein